MGRLSGGFDEQTTFIQIGTGRRHHPHGEAVSHPPAAANGPQMVSIFFGLSGSPGAAGRGVQPGAGPGGLSGFGAWVFAPGVPDPGSGVRGAVCSPGWGVPVLIRGGAGAGVPAGGHLLRGVAVRLPGRVFAAAVLACDAVRLGGCTSAPGADVFPGPLFGEHCRRTVDGGSGRRAGDMPGLLRPISPGFGPGENRR